MIAHATLNFHARVEMSTTETLTDGSVRITTKDLVITVERRVEQQPLAYAATAPILAPAQLTMEEASRLPGLEEKTGQCPVSVQTAGVSPVPVQTADVILVPVQTADVSPVPVQTADVILVPVQTADVILVPVQMADVIPIPQTADVIPIPVQTADVIPIPVQMVDDVAATAGGLTYGSDLPLDSYEISLFEDAKTLTRLNRLYNRSNRQMAAKYCETLFDVVRIHGVASVDLQMTTAIKQCFDALRLYPDLESPLMVIRALVRSPSREMINEMIGNGVVEALTAACGKTGNPNAVCESVRAIAYYASGQQRSLLGTMQPAIMSMAANDAILQATLDELM